MSAGTRWQSSGYTGADPVYAGHIAADGFYAGHEPSRPTWRCQADECAEAWPCPPARRKMADTLTLRTCGEIMTGWLIVAACDLGSVLDSAGLFDRFMLWIWLLPTDRAVNEPPSIPQQSPATARPWLLDDGGNTVGYTPPRPRGR